MGLSAELVQLVLMLTQTVLIPLLAWNAAMLLKMDRRVYRIELKLGFTDK